LFRGESIQLCDKLGYNYLYIQFTHKSTSRLFSSKTDGQYDSEERNDEERSAEGSVHDTRFIGVNRVGNI
jgi:hypothetical protein